jgi:hypothetical protein
MAAADHTRGGEDRIASREIDVLDLALQSPFSSADITPTSGTSRTLSYSSVSASSNSILRRTDSSSSGADRQRTIQRDGSAIGIGPLVVQTAVELDPIQAAIESFVCPPGWIKVEPPLAITEEEGKRGVSISFKEPTQLHRNGVILERDKNHPEYGALTKEEKARRLFYCLVTKECRDSKTVLRISIKANSTAVAHVKHPSHKGYAKWEETSREATAKANVTRVATRITATLNDRDAKSFLADKGRFYTVNAVKDLIVGKMLPFSYWESDDVKHHYAIINPDFPVASLHNKAVKHILLEFYSHLTSSISTELAEVKQASPSAFVTANLDLWTSKVSKGVYIGKHNHKLKFSVSVFPINK